MPFSDLEETIVEINFEHGVDIGKLITEAQFNFLRKERTIRELNSKRFAEEYNTLFNEPFKREDIDKLKEVFRSI